jgi:hypothetical protein
MGGPVEFDLSTYSDALHIVFGDSGAGTLKQALRKAGVSPNIISGADELSCGPINPPEPRLRIEWFNREFGPGEFVGKEWIQEAADQFWSVALADWKKRVVWFSRRSAMEYCWFLEWVRRAGSLNYDVIDLTDTKVISRLRDGSSRERLLETLGVTEPDVIPLKTLLQNSRSLTASEHQCYLELWTKLQTENAAFRVVGDFGIKSEPLEFYDELILSCAKADWQKSARVVGNVFGEMFEIPYYSVGDTPLFGRIRALVATGRLEARGDLAHMQSSEVRLKQL